MFKSDYDLTIRKFCYFLLIFSSRAKRVLVSVDGRPVFLDKPYLAGKQDVCSLVHIMPFEYEIKRLRTAKQFLSNKERNEANFSLTSKILDVIRRERNMNTQNGFLTYKHIAVMSNVYKYSDSETEQLRVADKKDHQNISQMSNQAEENAQFVGPKPQADDFIARTCSPLLKEDKDKCPPNSETNRKAVRRICVTLPKVALDNVEKDIKPSSKNYRKNHTSKNDSFLRNAQMEEHEKRYAGTNSRYEPRPYYSRNSSRKLPLITITSIARVESRKEYRRGFATEERSTQNDHGKTLTNKIITAGQVHSSGPTKLTLGEVNLQKNTAFAKLPSSVIPTGSIFLSNGYITKHYFPTLDHYHETSVFKEAMTQARKPVRLVYSKSRYL